MYLFTYLAAWSISSKVTHNFCLTCLQIRGSHDPLFGWDHLLKQLTERSKSAYAYQFITL